MIRVEQHIATLLKKHDCVQVPDFGGFVLNKSGAGFWHAHELLPPGKALTFNRNLHMNDGLLFSHISNTGKMPYYQAISEVQQSVKQWKTTLAEKHILQLADIGTIKQENDGRWQFEPELKTIVDAGSYGLAPVQLIQLDAAQPKPQPKNKEIYVADKSVTKVKTNYRKIGGYWIKRAVTVSGLSVMILFALFFAKHFRYPVDMGSPQSARIETPVQMPETAIEIPQQQIETPQQANILDKVVEETAAVAEQVFAQKTQFHIVGGSFSSEKNARNFERELENKGYSAEVLHNENGFYRVTYFTEADSLVADKLLQKVKTEENQSAWLLKW